MKTESVNNGWRDAWLPVMALAVAGALFWAAGWEADTEARDHLAILRNEIADKAQISEAIITSRLRAYDDTLLALREIYAADPAQFDKRVQWLRSGPLADRELLVVVLDREGYLAYTDAPNVKPGLDLRQRPYFRYFADGGEDRFYIDEPVLGRVTQRYSLPLARPIYGRDGAFQGIVALSIRQESLANFDPDLRLSGATTISVVTKRGALVARSRDPAKGQGWTTPPEMLAKLLEGNKGVFSSPATVHGDERILAFRHLEGLPLVVYASASPRQVLDRIAKQRTVLMSSAGIVSLLVLLLALAYRQRQRITAKFVATQQAHLKEAQRIAGMGSWELDLATKRFQWSDEMYGIFGISRNSVHPDFDYFLSRVVEADRSAVRAAIEKAAIDDSGSIEFSMLRGDAQRRELVARFESARNKAGKVTHLIGTVRDITEHKQAEKALHDSEHGYRTMINSAPEGVWMLGSDRRTSEVNQRMCDLLGYAREDMLGRNAAEFADEENGRIFQQQAQRVPSRQTRTYEVALRHRDGHNIPTEFSATNLFNEDGSVMGVLAFVTDITEHKLAAERIQRVAHHDSLTGLPNRLLFKDRLSQTIAASRRSGHHGALIFLDLDNFKPLNDTHGHEVGDLLLIEVAYRLKTCVREIDTVARFGGDEFVVVISELGADGSESHAQAGVIAEKIRAALAKPYVLKVRHEGKAESTVEHRCTASIGVALFGRHEASQEDILKRADRAMYQAKEAGCNSIRFFDPNVGAKS